VKSKGDYGETTIEKNPQTPIVYEAIRTFLLDGTPMEKTIKKCKDVAKFCTSRAVTGGAIWNDIEYPNSSEYEEYLKKIPFKQNKALCKRNERYQKEFIKLEAEKWVIGKTVRFYYARGGKSMYYKTSLNRVPMTEGCKPMMELKKKVPKDLDYGAYFSLAERYLKDLGYVDN